MNAPLLELHSVYQAFPKPDGEDLLVLDDINLSLADRQIVGLLGRSGSGKSTLLRLIAGLARPTFRHHRLPGQAGDRARARASPWCSKPSPCFPG